MAAQVSHAANDYIAVDAHGRKLGGPYKYYDEAKLHASRGGGYVQLSTEYKGEPAANDFAVQEGCPCDRCSHSHPPSVPTSPCGEVVGVSKTETVVVAAEEGVRVLYESRASDNPKRKPLRWRRAGGSLEAKGVAGTYRISKRKPDRRRGQLPIVLGRDGLPIKDFDSVVEAKAFANHFDVIWPSAVVAGPTLPKAACGPFAFIQRDPKVFEACRSKAEAIGPIDSIQDVWKLVVSDITKYDQEVVLVVPLGHHGELRELPILIAQGERARVSVDPADVVRAALLSGSSSVWLVHNHPSSKTAKPSPADMELTKTVQRAIEAVGGKTKDIPSTITFEGHAVVTPKQVGDARTGRVYKMA